MEKGRLNYEGLLSLEQPLLKVPAEQLKKSARTTQRYVEYVMKEVTAELGKMSKGPKDTEDATRRLGEVVTRLQKLKRKLAETKGEEQLYIHRTKVRLTHLKELMGIQSAESDEYTRWSQTRLDRILADYMLRNGYAETAGLLASEGQLKDLVDQELFQESRQVEDALRNMNCAEALRWCTDNRSSLEKIQSTLEFNIRLQEYIELVRSQKREEAIKYARKYLTGWQATHLKEIQQALALLAFSPDTSCEVYRELFDESRWDILIAQFHDANHALHNLTSQPLLTMTLQAGLSALKTPMCYQSADQVINCPVCAGDTLGVLADQLPNAHHVNSCMVDRISGVVMAEDNPPLVLPNGYVYSSQSLKEMADANGGMMTCPRTKMQYHISTTRKAFIL
ncbi:CTLH/CRA C-terminal to lish motif domain-containing protein [Phlyctochytrium arcticum]|nr:CTLH/CRA C-terminal to lish motif domain-containing protein [Phlyctochytrium arcticum]